MSNTFSNSLQSKQSGGTASRSHHRNAKETSQASSTAESHCFDDNRPEAITQLKLQEASDNSPHVRHAARLQELAATASRFNQLQKVITKNSGSETQKRQMKGTLVNDNLGVETEVNRMGAQRKAEAKAGKVKQTPNFASTIWSAKERETGQLKSELDSRPPTLQAVWKESKEQDAKLEWDSLMDGVQWYATEDGQMWYNVKIKGAADYSKWQGVQNKDTFEKWEVLRWAAFPEEYPVRQQMMGAIPNTLYKGVSKTRLKEDRKESQMPTGVRFGSATQIAMAKTGRKDTKLDAITLWFADSEEGAKDYCAIHSDSILLQINVAEHPVLKLGNDYFTTVPVDWARVKYLNNQEEWVPLGAKCPTDAKDMSE